MKTKTMKTIHVMVEIDVDEEHGLAYMHLTTAKVAHTCWVNESVLVDTDADKQIVGIEILDGPTVDRLLNAAYKPT